jgi:hypothetical protein
LASGCGFERTAVEVPASVKVSALDEPPEFSMLPLYTLDHNPNGFIDGSGRPVWLSGMVIDRKEHGWPLIDDETLQRIHDNGGNYAHIRLGPFVRWHERPEFEAYRYVDEEGVYNLEFWNEPFWDRVRQVLRSAEKLGIYVEVDVADGWTMKFHGDQEEHWISPWQAGNNRNGAQYRCADMMPEGWDVHIGWIEKVAEVTAEFPNAIYQVGNETDTCRGMAKPAWENLVVSTIRSHRADPTISTNSADPNLENADRIDYVNRHHGEAVPKALERSWDKPAGINEYGQSTPETYSREVWHGFALGTYLQYWANDDDFFDQQYTLAAVHFFQSVVNKTRFLHYTQWPIDKGRLVGEPDRDYIGFLAPDDPDPTIFITDLREPLYDTRWYDVMTRELKIAEVRSGGAQPFNRPGTPNAQTWIVHVNAHEQPNGLWLDERFDELDNGLLHGQHQWARIDDSPTVEGSTAKVVHIPAGNRVFAVDKDVPIQTRGKHRLDLRVQVNDNTTPTMAKLELKTLRSPASPLDDKKFQIEVGGDRFRVNRFGVTEEFVIRPGEVQLGHWYDLRCDIDLDANTVAIYVDGALAVPAYSMLPGPITDVQLMGFAFGPSGSVEFDDLRAGPVRFFDVPPWHPFYQAIEAFAQRGISAGCGTNQFCPDDDLTRAQLAVFLLRAKHGTVWTPAPARGIFPDVPASDPYAPWIEALYAEGIVASCSSIAFLYCPASPSTRAEMAAYLLRARHADGYQPPPPEFFFADVSHRDPYVAWIDQLFREHITAGCAASPLRYCPVPTVSRGQMAAFMNATFFPL